MKQKIFDVCSKFFNRVINIKNEDNIIHSELKVKHLLITLLALFLFLWVYINSFATSRVDGVSMMPTLHNEDYLLVKKYWFSGPERGDIISVKLDLEHNGYDGETVVKRVIGMPGEIVEFKNRRFSVINPELGYIKFAENYLEDPQLTPSWGNDSKATRFLVPEGQYFVLGDNREESEDSRSYGTVLEDNIKGKVIYKLPSVFAIENPEYEFKFESVSTKVMEELLQERKDKEEEESRVRLELIEQKKVDEAKRIEEEKLKKDRLEQELFGEGIGATEES